MQAGRLDRRITIQTYSEVTDAYGQRVKTWGDLATVWATVTPVSARELVASGVIEGQATTQFIIRHRTDVDSNARITYDGKTYDIQAVLGSEDRKRFLKILANEGMNNG